MMQRLVSVFLNIQDNPDANPANIIIVLGKDHQMTLKCFLILFRYTEMMCDMTDLSRLGMRAINGHRSRGFIRVGKSVNITCAKPRRAPASRDQQHHGHHGSNQLRYHGKKMVATCFPPLHATDHDGQLNWVGRFLVASPNEAEESSLRAASRSMNCR